MTGQRMFKGDEARGALIEAGIALMTESGRPGTVGQASFSEAITRSGVPRPSAYRLFGNDDAAAQIDFQNHVAIAVVQQAGDVFLDIHASEIQAIFADAMEAGTVVGSDALTPLLADLVRRIGPAIIDAVSSKSEIVMGLSAMVSTLSNRPIEEINRTVGEARGHFVDEFAGFLTQILDAFGLRVKEDWTLNCLAASCIDAIIGAVLSSRIAAGLCEIKLPTGDAKEVETWSLLSLTLAALLSSSTEPDPRRVASAHLSDWLTSRH